MAPFPTNLPSESAAGHPALAALRMASQWMAGGRKLQRTLATALAPIGLGESELIVLLAIDERAHENEGAAKPLDQKQLAHELGLSPALVSQLVESMRRRAWIVSERDPADRRRQIWRMTPPGRELLDQAIARLAPWAMQLQQVALAEQTALDRLVEFTNRAIAVHDRIDAASPTVSVRGDAA